MKVRKNDSNTGLNYSAVPSVNTSANEYYISVSDTVSCVAGDNLSVYMATIGTVQSYTSTGNTSITITKVG
jgi:hypothetical protein